MGDNRENGGFSLDDLFAAADMVAPAEQRKEDAGESSPEEQPLSAAFTSSFGTFDLAAALGYVEVAEEEPAPVKEEPAFDLAAALGYVLVEPEEENVSEQGEGTASAEGKAAAAGQKASDDESGEEKDAPEEKPVKRGRFADLPVRSSSASAQAKLAEEKVAEEKAFPAEEEQPSAAEESERSEGSEGEGSAAQLAQAAELADPEPPASAAQATEAGAAPEAPVAPADTTAAQKQPAMNCAARSEQPDAPAPSAPVAQTEKNASLAAHPHEDKAPAETSAPAQKEAPPAPPQPPIAPPGVPLSQAAASVDSTPPQANAVRPVALSNSARTAAAAQGGEKKKVGAAKIVGTVFAVLAVIAVVAAAILFVFSGRALAQSEASAHLYSQSASQAEYRYCAYDTDHKVCPVTETAMFGKGGQLLQCTLSMTASSEEAAQETAEVLKRYYGDDFIGGGANGREVTVALNLMRHGVSQQEYTVLLMEQASDFEPIN